MNQTPKRAGGRRNGRSEEVTRLSPLQHFTQEGRHYEVNTSDVAAPLGTNGLGQRGRYQASPGVERSGRSFKRASDEPLDHERRRTVTRTAHQYDDLDDIPHRSSPCRSPLVTPNTSFTSKSTATTRQSFANTSFSTRYESETSLSSQESLSQSSSYQKDVPITLPDRLSGTVQPNKHTHSLEKRLEHVWPKLPESLNHAPLGVVWEITRAAAHCGVDVGEFDLRYESGAAWHEQKKLRAQLATRSELFRGKGLPPQSDDAVWAASLESFRSGTKVVVLSVEFQAGKPSDPFYIAKLDPLHFHLGHRLDRRWGSDRLLEVTIPTLAPSKSSGLEADRERERSKTIIRWLCGQAHYFLGRLWAPFFTRPTKKPIKDVREPEKSGDQYLEQIYFFAIDGNNFTPSIPNSAPPQDEAEMLHERTKMSLSELFEWSISGSQSGNQRVPKLFSRLALNLSRTIPTVTLKPEQIRFRKDIVSTKRYEKVMNDGIGRISRSLANKIAASLGLTVAPCAYQARFGSAKGMWVIDLGDDESNENDWIELYESQIKWKCNFQDPQHLTFEVKSWPRKLVSNALNQQFIPILETQAPSLEKKLAMRDAVAKHLVRGLQEDLDLAKAALSNSAALSLWMEKNARNFEQLDEAFVPFLGGLPDQNERRISYLVDCGFQPQSNWLLREMVNQLVDKRTNLLKKKWNIQVPCSTTALIVVDFEGVLKPNQVHLSFSSNFEVEGFSDTLLEERDILVARSPSHFPSDIQKVRVVSLPHLRKLKDVIVFPITGNRALADLLSGVTMMVIELPPLEYDFLREGILREATTFKFGDLKRNCDNLCKAYDEFRMTGFEFSMKGSLLGMCTKYKERSCYHGNPINGENAILLSVLLSYLVDQAKSGIEFAKDDWTRFLRTRLRAPISLPNPLYDGDCLPSNYKLDEHSRAGMHILDYLKFCVALPQIDQVRKEIKESMPEDGSKAIDTDLTQLAMEIDLRADQGSKDFKTLRKNLQAKLLSLKEEWSLSTAQQSYDSMRYRLMVETLHDKWLQISPTLDSPLTPELDLLLNFNWFSAHCASFLSQDNAVDPEWVSPYNKWALIKASWTYKMFPHHKFTWNIAGKQLAAIKCLVVSSSPALRHTAPGFLTPWQYNLLRPDKKIAARMAMLTGAGREDESVLALDEVTDYDDYGGLIDDL
uniref:RNA-dependent RNA polymerase n=1 Tax=Bionectria ochroleuca TaxID=29856 RepID=A0A8H7TRK7_BIOOC